MHVLDASAALSVVLDDTKGRPFHDLLAESERVIAPRLFASETANALWKYVRFGNLSLDAAESALDKALSLPDEYVDDEDLAREALALAAASQKPAYDMFYLILSRRNAAMLLTADRELSKLARKHGVKTL